MRLGEFTLCIEVLRMPHCPNCQSLLTTHVNPAGIHYVCCHCAGRAVFGGQLRRVIGDDFVERLKQQLASSYHSTQKACPFCEHTIVSLEMGKDLQEFAACRRCGVIWFRVEEFNRLGAIIKDASSEAAAVECTPPVAETSKPSWIDQPLTNNSWKLLAAAVLHFLGEPRTQLPCVGASGGIAGVIAF